MMTPDELLALEARAINSPSKDDILRLCGEVRFYASMFARMPTTVDCPKCAAIVTCLPVPTPSNEEEREEFFRRTGIRPIRNNEGRAMVLINALRRDGLTVTEDEENRLRELMRVRDKRG